MLSVLKWLTKGLKNDKEGLQPRVLLDCRLAVCEGNRISSYHTDDHRGANNKQAIRTPKHPPPPTCTPRSAAAPACRRSRSEQLELHRV